MPVRVPWKVRLHQGLGRRQASQLGERNLLLESMYLLHELSPRGVPLQGVLQRTSGLVLDVIHPSCPRMLVAKEVDATMQIRPVIADNRPGNPRLGGGGLQLLIHHFPVRFGYRLQVDHVHILVAKDAAQLGVEPQIGIAPRVAEPEPEVACPTPGGEADDPR